MTHGAPRRQVRFEVGARSGPVSGILSVPESAGVLLVLSHGAGAGMRHRFMEGLTGCLDEAEVATLRYQFPYAEAGRGRPDRTPVLVATVRAAVAAARELEPDLPLLAGGKSMGGRMTSLAQAERPLPGVRGIAFFGFPLHRPGDPSDARADHLREVQVPKLFLQGTRDRLAALDRLRSVVNGLGPSATLHVVEDGDHGFDVLKRTGRTAREVYAEMAGAVRQWAGPLTR